MLDVRAVPHAIWMFVGDVEKCTIPDLVTMSGVLRHMGGTRDVRRMDIARVRGVC